MWGSLCFKYETWLDGIYIANAKPTEFTKSNKQGRVKVIMFTMMQIAITFRPKDLGTMNLIKRAGSKSRPGLVATMMVACRLWV